MQNKPYVLWLASWYPNKINPFEGDFIQRHAVATALYMPVTVFYVCQSGPGAAGNEDSYIKYEKGNLTEIIVFFRSPLTKSGLLNILLYNFRYQKIYKNSIEKYFSQHGMPVQVHVHIPMKAGMIALWIRKKWKINYVLTEHSTHYGMGSEDDFVKKSLLHRKLVQKIFRNAEVVVNVSKALGSKIKGLFNLRDYKIINNTVDTSLFQFNPQESNVFRFIHVSSLEDKHKNVTGILKAVKALSTRRTNFQLIVVGPLVGPLQQLARDLGIEKLVIFTCEIAYVQVSCQLKKASAFVLFSWYENSPCVIGEALCCGLPVIASDTGGISELINSSNGILINPGNIDALSAAMENAMDNYSNYDRQLIASNAAEKFSFDKIGKKIVDLYTVEKPF